MTRDNAREIAVQILFGVTHTGLEAAEFTDSFLSEEHYATLTGETEVFQERPSKGQAAYIRDVVSGVMEHREEIDARIRSCCRGWALSRISGTALAVMRVAVYEMLWRDDVETGTAINSAVNIAKGYDDPEVVSFVNGVLGSVARTLDQPAEAFLNPEPADAEGTATEEAAADAELSPEAAEAEPSAEPAEAAPEASEPVAEPAEAPASEEA